MELDDYTIYVYSPTMIAIEKLRAICQQMPEYALQRRPSARARDFYDIYRERYVKSICYTDLGAGFCRGFS